MKDRLSLAIVVGLVFVVIYGVIDWHQSHSRTSAAPFEDAAEEPSGEVNVAGVTSDIATSTPLVNTAEVPAAPATSTGAAAELGDDEARAKFTKALHDLSSCLAMKSEPLDGAEPRLENWLSAIRGEMGDPVLQTEDWSSAEIETPEGEHRSIRVEMDYSGEDRIVRRVKYSKVGADGEPGEQIPLSKEQSEEPSDTFLASLESDGKIVKRETAQRLYFGGGEEIVVTEKNGKVYELDMSRAGRTFKCRPFDPDPNSCKCL